MQILGINPSKWGDPYPGYPGSGSYEDNEEYEYDSYYENNWKMQNDDDDEYSGSGLMETSTKPRRKLYETTTPTHANERKTAEPYIYIEEDVTASQ